MITWERFSELIGIASKLVDETTPEERDGLAILLRDQSAGATVSLALWAESNMEDGKVFARRLLKHRLIIPS